MYGNYFRAKRNAAGLSLRVASQRIGITPDGLHKIETGQTNPLLRTLKLMADVYGCEIGDLLPHSVDGLGVELTQLSKVLEPLPDSVRRYVVRRALTEARALAGVPDAQS